MAKAKGDNKEAAGGRGRGRPPADHPLSARVLSRFEPHVKAALDEYVRAKGLGGASTAVRVIVMERLKKEGLL